MPLHSRDRMIAQWVIMWPRCSWRGLETVFEPRSRETGTRTVVFFLHMEGLVNPERLVEVALPW